MPTFEHNIHLVSLFFLKRSLVFPILLFSSISLHCSLRKHFLSLLAVLWNPAFSWVYLSFSPLPLASLFFSAICKASSDSHFDFFFHLFFLQMVLIPVSCTMLQPSSHSSSGSLSIRSSPLNLDLRGQGQNQRGTKGRAKTKAEDQRLCDQGRGRKLFLQPQVQWIKYPQSA